MAKNNLNAPIVRGSGFDPYEPVTKKEYKYVPLYSVFLYRNRKPVYKLMCSDVDALKEAIKNFTESDNTLEMLCRIQHSSILENNRYDDVVVEDCNNS